MTLPVDPLDEGLSTFEALQAYRALRPSGEGSRDEWQFIVSREAAIQSKKTNSRVTHLEERMESNDTWHADKDRMILKGSVILSLFMLLTGPVMATVTYLAIHALWGRV